MSRYLAVTGLSQLIFTSPPRGLRNIVMSMSVCLSVRTQSSLQQRIVRREMYSTRVWKVDSISICTRYHWRRLFIGFLAIYYCQVQERSGGLWEICKNVTVITHKKSHFNRNGIRPVKNWVVGCWHGYLSGWGADLHIAQQLPLPLTISCSSKSRLALPSCFYLTGTGSPG